MIPGLFLNWLVHDITPKLIFVWLNIGKSYYLHDFALYENLTKPKIVPKSRYLTPTYTSTIMYVGRIKISG